MIIAPARNPDAGIMKRREMINNPAVMDSLEPVERAVLIAAADKTISEYGAAELSDELAIALRGICKDVGYRSQGESDRQYLIIRTAEILKRYYPGFSLKDFRMAFEMSITGELDDFLPRGRDGQPDKNHYQQFNAEYVCRILNAYKARRSNVLYKSFGMIPEPETGRDIEQERAAMNRVKSDCIGVFDFFKENGYLPDISPVAQMLYYNLLSRAGLAEEIEVTEEEQREVYALAVNRYALDGALWDMNRLKQEGTGAKELEHGSFVLARRKALAATFRRMIEKRINIFDYIKLE